jgi:hypothetical protein
MMLNFQLLLQEGTQCEIRANQAQILKQNSEKKIFKIRTELNSQAFGFSNKESYFIA